MSRLGLYRTDYSSQDGQVAFARVAFTGGMQTRGKKRNAAF